MHRPASHRDLAAACPSASQRVMVLATEDWFVASHFLPLLRALQAMGLDVNVVTQVRDKRSVIEATGARVTPFDFGRDGRLSAWREAAVARRLHWLLRDERPDAVHAIALKPIALACLVAAAGSIDRLVIHLTGVGFAGTATGSMAGRVYRAAMWGIARTLKRRKTWLFVENPDDMARVGMTSPSDQHRVTILGGAGVDPSAFPITPLPEGPDVTAGFVGRMVWSKGVDVLIEAQRLMRVQGKRLNLHLCGDPDVANPRAIPQDALLEWQTREGVVWHGRVTDIAGFWQGMTFSVVPSRGGEGLPRALLEAAASGRALIVTDVPGCRLFVRDGIEGLVVPPENPDALARAMTSLANDPKLAADMGRRARERLLGGFTEAQVGASIAAAYRTLLAT